MTVTTFMAHWDNCRLESTNGRQNSSKVTQQNIRLLWVRGDQGYMAAPLTLAAHRIGPDVRSAVIYPGWRAKDEERRTACCYYLLRNMRADMQTRLLKLHHNETGGSLSRAAWVSGTIGSLHVILHNLFMNGERRHPHVIEIKTKWL